MPTILKSETAKQVNSISKAKIFTFLLDENIPPNNNASERAIRNVVVTKFLQTLEDLSVYFYIIHNFY